MNRQARIKGRNDGWVSCGAVTLCEAARRAVVWEGYQVFVEMRDEDNPNVVYEAIVSKRTITTVRPLRKDPV